MYFYTPPLKIIDKPADTKHYSRGRLSYEFIVLHDTEGTDSRNWLSTASVPPVSIHRLIARDGTIYKIVPDEDTAYGCGYSYLGGKNYYQSLNERSLQIELENLGTKGPQDYPMPQLQSTALQIVEWYAKFGTLPILYHYMIDSNKRDPYHFPRQVLDTLIFAVLKAVL